MDSKEAKETNGVILGFLDYFGFVGFLDYFGFVGFPKYEIKNKLTFDITYGRQAFP